MPRVTSEPVDRVHVHLYTEDIQFIRDTYGGQGNIGFNAAVRSMVRRICKELRAKRDEAARPVEMGGQIGERL